MTNTKTIKPAPEQKQAIADRLATLYESSFRPRKTPPRLARFAVPAPDYRDPATSPGLVVGLARLGLERAMRLSSADGCIALILAQTLGGGVIDGDTGEVISAETATALQVRAGRRLPRAERLLLQLVTASATRTLAGEAIVIGRNRRKPRKPHWNKRRLT